MSPQIVVRSEKPTITHRFVLIMKSWSTEIPRNWRNVIIAEALNYCVCKERLIIKGYLIKKKQLFLIAESKKHSIEYIFNVFAKQVFKGIHIYERRMNRDKEEFEEHYIFKDLFIKCRLYNPYIIKLLTGKKVQLCYYNSYLARLKIEIHYSNYCSVIDYSGAIGPVIVQTH